MFVACILATKASRTFRFADDVKGRSRNARAERVTIRPRSDKIARQYSGSTDWPADSDVSRRRMYNTSPLDITSATSTFSGLPLRLSAFLPGAERKNRAVDGNTADNGPSSGAPGMTEAVRIAGATVGPAPVDRVIAAQVPSSTNAPADPSLLAPLSTQ